MKAIALPVGNNLDNNPDDVMNVKTVLKDFGYYQKDVENGYIDREMDEAIFKFQKDKNLKQDGIMFPGGETEEALRVSVTEKICQVKKIWRIT